MANLGLNSISIYKHVHARLMYIITTDLEQGLTTTKFELSAYGNFHILNLGSLCILKEKLVFY